MHTEIRKLRDVTDNIDMVMSDTIMKVVHDWDLFNGYDEYPVDAETGEELRGEDLELYRQGRYDREVELNPVDIYQWFIICRTDAEMLQRHTDAIIYYSPSLEMYVWGIDTIGTPWEGVDIIWREEE